MLDSTSERNVDDVMSKSSTNSPEVLQEIDIEPELVLTLSDASRMRGLDDSDIESSNIEEEFLLTIYIQIVS